MYHKIFFQNAHKIFKLKQNKLCIIWPQRSIATFNLSKTLHLHRIYFSNQNNLANLRMISIFNYKQCKEESQSLKEVQLSRKEKLKRTVKEYGSTVIVFHVAISLISLGTCYVLVSSGIDMNKVLIAVGLSGSSLTTSASTFVTAYAIHKVFAPVRISITLAATPFIVRYLRNIGFLKLPKPK